MGKITAVHLRNFKPKDKPYSVADGGGLSAHVATTGTISWRYRYRYNGKLTTLVIGQFPIISLQEARKRHQEARALLHDGINPTAQRRADRQQRVQAEVEEQRRSQNSFQKIAMEWMNKQQDRWSANHGVAVRRSLEQNVFPYIGHLPIEDVTPRILKATATSGCNV